MSVSSENDVQEPLVPKTSDEAHDLFRMAFDQSGHGRTLSSVDGRFLCVNQAMAELLGYTRAELMEISFRKITHPEDIEASDELMRCLKAGEQTTYRLEKRYLHRNGNVIWALLSTSLLHAEDGEPLSFMSDILDITDQKQILEQVKSSEAKHRLLFDGMLNGVAYCQMLYDQGHPVDFTYLSVNAAFEKQTGLRDLIGKKASEAIAGLRESNSELFEIFGRVAVTGNPESFEIYLEALQIWFAISVYSQQDDHVVAVFEAITQRKQAEAALYKTQQLLNESQRIAKVGAWEFDVAAGQVLWTDEVYTIYGLTLAFNPLHPEQALQFYRPEDRPRISEAFQRVVEQGEDYDLELQLNVAQSKTLWVRTVGHAELKDGKVIRVFGNIMDITQHKQAEIERQRLLEQLNHAQKMEAIGRLAGGVAHDFNNMLSVIQGYAELALMQVKEGERLFRPLREIQDAAVRSAVLTRQLLAFARKQPNNPRLLDLNETVTGMLRMLGRLIGEDIQIDWIPSPELRQVLLDPSQVDQILANLIVNARDAIQGVGQVTIETSNVTFDENYCRLHPDSSPGDYVLLTVSDSGCGMDKELIAQIFEPFFTTKEKGAGTGLGLSTVYGIVKQNKGLIYVYSEPGLGSSFKIYLPEALAPAEPEVVTVEVATVGGRETVLVVDDEPGIVSMAKEMLLKYGYQVITAASPVEAMATAAEYAQKINLLLTDVIMPGMNGKELSQQMTTQRPELRTLYMSGFTDNVIAANNTLANDVAFLQKPFSVLALAAKVRQVLDAE